MERGTGLAVLDTDPLKLHYSWSLWRAGVADRADFEHQARAYREAISERRIGFADRFLVSLPDSALLRERRAADTTRQRRNFELHAQLAAPLRSWYATVDQVRPGSVGWHFSDELLDHAGPMRDRYSLPDFDALLERLNSA